MRVESQNDRPPGPGARAHPCGAGPKSEKIGVRHGVLGPRVFGVINAGNVESMELACRNATEEPFEANLVKLLGLWSAGWKHRGRTRAVGPGAYERYATLGLFGHGGVVGVSNATGLREACLAVNRFLRTRFPDGTWSSIAVLFNPRMGLHRDIQEHARALESCAGSGGVHRRAGVDRRRRRGAWLEDKKGGWELRGRWLDMHDKPVSFDARRYHKVESHEGSKWALALMSHKPMLKRRSSTGRRYAKRSGLSVACVKLIACKQKHVLSLPSKVGTLRPATCRPEVAFDPSRRFCLASRSRPAGALTCVRRCAWKSPLIRPAGFAWRSVSNLSEDGVVNRHNRAFPPEACRGPPLVLDGAPGSGL